MGGTPPASQASRAESFLAAVDDPARREIEVRVAVVVAHPDDETIGCGCLLRRLADSIVIHVTDGAPRNLLDAQALGFSTAEGYAAARRSELEGALSLVGVGPERLHLLGWADQAASLHLVEIAHVLSFHLAGFEVVITHAYEGGHPDHDATAFAVHGAVGLIRSRRDRPTIIEMPLYRAGPDGWAAQSFVPDTYNQEVVVDLSQGERDLKRRMFDAFASQRHVLVRFSAETERFRAAPSYDFLQLPNGGDLHYERMGWGMTGARWLELSRAALAELGQGAAA